MPPAFSDSRKQCRSVDGLELGDEFVASFAGGAAVQPQHRYRVAVREVRHEQFAPLGELCEAQRLVTGGDQLVEQLLDAVELARSAVQGAVVLGEVGRVVETCLSLVMPASTNPRRCWPSASSAVASRSSTTAW